MRVQPVPSHRAALEGLWRAAALGRLPHGLLFEGQSGVGKFQAALWFGAGLLCRKGPGAPCGECRACRQLGSGDWRGGHPDFLRIDPVEEGWDEIPVAAIADRSGGDSPVEQSLLSFLALKPMEGGLRVVCLREAERLNEAAQNALLKTLEEPAVGTVLILECSRPMGLLATVRSRMVRLGLLAPPRDVAMGVLAAEGIDRESAGVLCALADNSPGEALRLARQGALECLGLWDRLADGQLDSGGLVAGVWDLAGEFGEGTALAVARRRVRAALDLALVLAAKGRLGAAGVPADLEGIPGGRGAKLVQLLARRGEGGARRALDQLFDRRRDVDSNLDPGAVLLLAALDLVPSPGVASRGGSRALPAGG